MDKKIFNALFYILIVVAILIGLFFAGVVIYLFVAVARTELKNTIMIIGFFLVFLVMVYCIKKARNEL